MCYSTEPRDRRYVKGYGFLSFARNIGKNISNKYTQKLIDSAIKSGATKVAIDAIKTASKRAVQKTAEATRDLISSKIADNITSKKSKEFLPMELHSDETSNEIPKERYIPPKKTKNYW